MTSLERNFCHIFKDNSLLIIDFNMFSITSKLAQWEKKSMQYPFWWDYWSSSFSHAVSFLNVFSQVDIFSTELLILLIENETLLVGPASSVGSSGVIGSLSTGWRLWKQRKVPKQSNNSVWHLYKKHHAVHKTVLECSHHGKEPPLLSDPFPRSFTDLEKKKTETQCSEEACTQKLQPVVIFT